MVDNYKSEHITIDADEKIRLEAEVSRWIKSVMTATDLVQASDEMRELIETVQKFHIPVWPLEAFAKGICQICDLRYLQRRFLITSRL